MRGDSLGTSGTAGTENRTFSTFPPEAAFASSLRSTIGIGTSGFSVGATASLNAASLTGVTGPKSSSTRLKTTSRLMIAFSAASSSKTMKPIQGN